MTTPALVLTLEQGMIEGLKLLEQKDKMKPTLPTTTVQAYEATDGSLWLNEDECLDKNRQLTLITLKEHLEQTTDHAYFDSEDVAIYIRDNFDEIKAILGK